jgi:pyruvate dehydrogenase E2 component (dihydrolipoamide acetyltransferase)
MADFTMPSLGADMDEGTLLEWLVKPGDSVHKGDVVAVVDTSKAAIEVESFVEGVVGDLLVEPGTVVPVGTALATIESAAQPAGVRTPQRKKAAQRAAESPPPAAPAATAVAEHPETTSRDVHSPLVRRLAHQLGVDLGRVTGTGRDGSITRADVTRAAEVARGRAPTAPAKPSAGRVSPYARRLAAELGVDLATLAGRNGEPVRAADVRAAASAPPTPAPAPAPADEPVATAPTAKTGATKQEQMRATIAALMSRAKREIPHYYLSTTVDLGPALAWMHERNLGLPVTERLVPAALLLKATALAAAGSPALNGFWVDGAFVPGSGVHLGVAVSLRGGGLVAPALHDADRLTLAEVMAGMRDLVTRARAGRLRGSEMSDPTLTVTNLGDQGVDAVYGVIYPPQVALVGFGRVVERPWAVDGLLGVRPVTELTLAADHRATDGFTGGRFLAAIEQHLQRPEEL